MSGHALDDDLRRAVTALHAAMAVLRRHAENGVEVEMKDNHSPVTAADREVDALLAGMLPISGDGWLSEESVDDGARVHCRRVWVVDPLDGTRAFAAGRSDYSVSIGLVVDGEPALGAIGNPVSGVAVFGGPGLGVQVEGHAELPWADGDPRLRVLASRSEVRRGEWQPQAATAQIHPVGSVAYKLALVAGGFADATFTMHPKHEWDVAAGAALVRAGGGEVWLPRGGHLLWNRARPRFLSFAAARAGVRPAVEALVPKR